MEKFVFAIFLFLLGSTFGCLEHDWSSSFSKAGFSSCPDRNHFLSGFKRDTGNKLLNLKKVECCQSDNKVFAEQISMCLVSDWTVSSVRKSRTSCPPGFFAQGIRRSSKNDLRGIKYGYCCKPSYHPYFYGDCYNQNVRNTFNKPGWSKCSEGYFVTGITRSGGYGLNNIEELKCCQMVPEPINPKSMEDVKTRVMDATQFLLGIFANYLGYGWCGGCRGEMIGDDFRRNGDSWESDMKGPCEGTMADHRLKMHYKFSGFVVKQMVYGDPVVESSTPSVYLSGKVNNDDEHDTVTTVSREVMSVRSVTHVSTSNWKTDTEFGVEISYTPPDSTGGVGVKSSLKFAVGSGGSESKTQATKDIFSVHISSSKSLKPKKAAEWRIMLTKQRITMPYAAVIAPKFTVELDGFLRWGKGYDGVKTNYHVTHRGSKDRPTFKYTFGSAKKPFYEALKEEVQQNKRPWMWHDMIQKYNNDPQVIIDMLANELHYMFVLHGQFEDIQGTHAEITWKEIPTTGDQHEDEGPDDNNEGTSLPRVFPKPPEVKLESKYEWKELPKIKEDPSDI